MLSLEDLRFEYKTESGLNLKIFYPMLDRVKGAQKLHESSSICEESLHTKESCQAKFLEGHLIELGLLIGPNEAA